MAARVRLQRHDFLNHCRGMPSAGAAGCNHIVRDAVPHKQRRTAAGAIFRIHEIKQLSIVSSGHHGQGTAAQAQRSLCFWVQKRASRVTRKKTGLQRTSNNNVKQQIPIIGKRGLHHDAHKKRHAVANNRQLGAAVPQVTQVRDELSRGINEALGVRPNGEEEGAVRIAKSAKRDVSSTCKR